MKINIFVLLMTLTQLQALQKQSVNLSLTKRDYVNYICEQNHYITVPLVDILLKPVVHSLAKKTRV